VYNSLDKEFLATMDIAVVDDPTGFGLASEASLVYMPGAEQYVAMNVYYRLPDLMIANSIDLYYRNAEGTAYPKQTATRLFDGTTATVEEKDLVQELDDRDKRAYQNHARVCEKFLYYHDATRLTDLDAPNHPFHGNYLYYRKDLDDTDRPASSEEPPSTDPITT
jgi:hypothetical protein